VALLLAGLGGTASQAAEGPTTISELKRLNVEDLMNIEVTSVARRPGKLLASASAIQVITGEQIRRSGAATLAQALRLADNLQVAQRGARGWAVSARGFNTELANKLLVMIDGRTVYTPLFSGVFWEAQDYLLEDIDRIEVVSGPGGTLWGANAVNGVISIITRSAAETTGFYAEAGGGAELNAIAAMRYGAEIFPGVHFRAFGKHMDHDDSQLGNGSPAGDSWQRSQGGFRTDFGDVDADAFTVQGDFYNNEQRDPQADGLTTLRGANVLGRWSRRIAEDSSLSLQTYYDWTRFSDPVPAAFLGATEVAPAGRLRDHLYTFDVDFQHRFRAGGAHGFTWGLGFRHTRDRIDNAPALTFLPARLEQQLFSLFFQDEIRLRDSLLLTVGSKLEHNDYTGFEYEPSARLQWHPSDAQTLWSAVSRAIRAPSRIDRDLFQPAPEYFPILYGNPAFKSEKLVAWELGYRAGFAQRASLSIAAFYNEYDDLRSTAFTPVSIVPFYFVNDLVGHTRGVELTGGVQLTANWHVRAGYNLLQSRLRVRPGGVDISNARNETADPEQQVSIRSSLTLPWGLEFDAGLRWVDILHNNNGPEPGTVPYYLDLEARLAWHPSPRLELSLVGQNLLHDRHPEYGFPNAARVEAQRSVYGKLAWRY
jgi:iron complex outermembrane receptor protein